MSETDFFRKVGFLALLKSSERKVVDIADLMCDLPSPRQILRLWLPSPKLGSGVFIRGFPPKKTTRQRGWG
jgi:hypothetical protein